MVSTQSRTLYTWLMDTDIGVVRAWGGGWVGVGVGNGGSLEGVNGGQKGTYVLLPIIKNYF